MNAPQNINATSNSAAPNPGRVISSGLAERRQCPIIEHSTMYAAGSSWNHDRLQTIKSGISGCSWKIGHRSYLQPTRRITRTTNGLWIA